MILDNARILTMDPTLPQTSALAIAGGRVLGGVDSREDVIASHAHERIDLQGATVVPGFVDAHVHFRAWALSMVRPDLAGCTTAQDAEQVLAEHAAQAPDGQAWIHASGLDERVLSATADLADRVAATSGLPVVIDSKDGHALLVSADALVALGRTPDSLEVDGGVVARTTDGKFTGLLRERSAWEVRRLLDDEPSTRDMAAAMRTATSRGVTSVHDMDGAAGFRAWRSLETERGLSLRVWQHFLADELDHLSALGITPDFGTDRLRVGGIKVFVDGTLGSGTAWLHEPEHAVAGEAARNPVVMTDVDELVSIITRAATVRMSVLAHAIGDAAFTAVVDALEQTTDIWQQLPHMPRIEHAQLARPTDIERCARLGIALSVQPSHLIYDRDVADLRWESRCVNAYAYRTMLDAGAVVTLGSDAPIEDLDPLAAMRFAVSRADGGREPWHPEQALTPEQALYASTSAVFQTLSSSLALGRLTPGREADLVVLSGDPMNGFDDVEVVATMVGGRFVFGRPNL